MDWTSDDAVTPVVGTVLILLVTMAGMGAVLAWGVPAVQGVQDQSTLSAMKGEFSDLRLRTLVLQVVDSSRVGYVALADGDLGLEPGSRFAFHLVHDQVFPGGGSTDPDCDIRVTGWHGSSDTLDVDVDSCDPIVGSASTPSTTQLEFQLDHLVGSSVRSRPSMTAVAGGSDWVITSSGDDFSDGDWRLRLIDSEGEAHAQVFILGTERIAWHLETSVNDMDLYLEGGALFHVDSPQVFSLAGVQINEDVFTMGDYLFEFPTYTGPEGSVGFSSDPQVFLQLQGSHGRVVGQDTFRFRFDVSGDLAEAWCNHILFRNASTTSGTYTEDSSAMCETGDSDGLRSVVFEPTGGGTFPFELIQKRVYVGITA